MAAKGDKVKWVRVAGEAWILAFVNAEPVGDAANSLSLTGFLPTGQFQSRPAVAQATEDGGVGWSEFA